MRKGLVLLALLPALVLADNYIALTFHGGANAPVVTYTYTIALTINGPLGINYATNTSSVVTLLNVPEISTTVSISYTPTLIGQFTIDGTLYITADNAGIVNSTSTTFNMVLQAGKVNTKSISVSLPNGASVEAFVQFYIAGIPAPALLAVALGGLLGLRKRRKKH